VGTVATIVSGGTSIDVRTGEQIEDSAVLIRDGRIERIGRAGDVRAPPGARAIDARGKWLLPGLIDAHAHVTGSPVKTELLGAYLANGVTTIRDMGGSLTPLRLLREEIEAGRRTAPRLLFAGTILDGLPPVWPQMSILADTPRRAESAVQFLADQGVDLIKVYNNISEPVLQTIVQSTHAAGLTVAGHVPRSITMRRAIDLGMDCLEHIRITGREFLPLEEADQIDYLPLPRRESLLWERLSLASPTIGEIIGRLVESQAFLDPTLTIDEAVFAGGLDEAEQDTDRRGIPAEVLERVARDRRPALYRVPTELKEIAREGFAKRQQFVGMCARAGVRIIAGTDAFGPGKYLPGFGLHNELELLVRSGLTPLQALQAATSIASAALRREHDVGSIEPGKRADLVFLSADPLRDIRNASKVDLVIKDGQVHQPATLLSGQPATGLAAAG
jgi:imidazolonepropionase-like amidohydrolase